MYAITRPRSLAGTLLAAAALTVGLAQPHAAQAATCAHADTVFTVPTRFASEPIETYANRVNTLRHNVRTAIFCLTNNERAARGLRLLTNSTTLQKAADRHAADMRTARHTSHIGSDGSTKEQRARAAGYCTGGSALIWENIYYQYPKPTARSVVQWWMNSAGHRATILDPSPRDLGVGLVFGTKDSSTGGTFVQNFGVCR
jgi:uncharacterized protein YkwD